ncbi:MAG: hypothetical protein FWG40_02595 [Peptococcaceae bacterium]|nr:hypothetical protein [Peptococcaceae bacterium]
MKMNGILIASGIVLVLLSAVFLLIIKNDTEVVKIEKNYVKLRERLEKQDSEKGIEVINFADDYARLFTRISEGNAADAKAYAQLVRTITDGTIEFEDEEVFSIAEDFAIIYKKIADGFDDFGVQQITIIEDGSGTCSLVIDYIGGDSGGGYGYSIRKMDKDEDEQVYFGERLVEADGSLGENRIEIMFHGTKSSALYNMYPSGTVHKLKGVPTVLQSNFNVRISSIPGADIFVIYVGSNEPLNIDEQDFKKIKKITGSVEIKLGK